MCHASVLSAMAASHKQKSEGVRSGEYGGWGNNSWLHSAAADVEVWTGMTVELHAAAFIEV